MSCGEGTGVGGQSPTAQARGSHCETWFNPLSKNGVANVKVNIERVMSSAATSCSGSPPLVFTARCNGTGSSDEDADTDRMSLAVDICARFGAILKNVTWLPVRN